MPTKDAATGKRGPVPPEWRRPGRVALVVALLAAGGAAGLARAQAPPTVTPLPEDTWVHDRWTVRDGLPVNHANALLQTPDGYLWIATFDGLVRYDGARFTVFNGSTTPGLPSSRIVSLFPGAGGSFWLATEQGDVVRAAGGRFEPSTEPVGPTLDVLTEPDGATWIAAESGLYRYEGGRLVRAFGGGPVLRGVSDVLRDRHGALWIATLYDGVWRVEGERVRRSAPGPEVSTTLFEDADGTLWAGGHGVSRYRDGAWRPFEPPGAPWARPDWGPDYKVWDFFRAPGGPLWLVTTRGLYRYAAAPAGQARELAPLSADGPFQLRRRRNAARCPDGTLWFMQEAALFHEGQPVASVGGTITDLLCDREGSLWVTTTSDGLHRFRRPLLHTVGERELGFRNVYNVYEDGTGALWFTGYGGVVSRLRGGAFRRYAFDAIAEPARNSDQAVYEDGAGNVWLGFQVCPAASRDADGACPRFAWAEGAPRKQVYAIRQTRDGALWFGTATGLYRLQDGRWAAFTTADGLSDDHVRFLLERRDGGLYAATFRGGVVRYREGRFAALTTADGLPSDHVRALHEDADGALWIGTEDRGLARLDPATGALTAIRQTDGLYYDGVHQIVEDDAGRLWMSTNRGIFWVRRAALDAFARGEVERVRSVAYTERDGMRNREANGGRQESALKASDGRLWFATQDGAVVVDPAEVAQHAPAPPVVVEGVEAGGATLPVPSPAPLVLAAGQRSFRIAYTAPSFVAPERMRFRYRLEGFDTGWVDAEGRREAVYTGVPPGDYVFRVSASNDGATWNDDGPPLALSVAPFFYETRGFQGLVGLTVLLLLLAAYRLRTRQFYRQQEELERRVAERTQALRTEKQKTEAQAERLQEMDRLKSRFFTNVSHEFRTPLTLTIGPLEDLLAALEAEEKAPSPAEARRQVGLALRNSRRLLRLINQLLDVAKLEAGEMRLDARLQDLAAFVCGIARSFAPLAERRRVRFTVDAPERPLPVPFDAEKLEQVLVNLLSNAFKFTSEGGDILVTVALEGAAGAAVVGIRDSGPGIAAEALPHLFERFYQAEETSSEVQPGTGIGLSLAKDLAELHGGTIAVESAVGFGATFTVRLPLGAAPLPGDGAPAPHRPPTTAARPPLQRNGHELDGGAPAEAAPEAAVASDEDDRTTVLIADDNAEIRAYVRSHLEPRYRVLEAADGAAALEAARTSLPDLVVSDVMMPALDGLALVRALRADPHTDFIPVLLLTARAAEADKVEGLVGGADAYLTKPFSVRELRALVDSLIASRQRLKARFAASPPAPAARRDRVEDAPDGVPAADAAFLARARAAVEAHLGDEEFGVEALAAALEQSRSTLHRRLRDLLEQSPSAFIRGVRLEHAAALLRERRGTISEVAYAVGFRSVSHFCQVFRGAYGVTPATYIDSVLEHGTGAG